jgi:hypothetical protein
VTTLARSFIGVDDRGVVTLAGTTDAAAFEVMKAQQELIELLQEEIDPSDVQKLMGQVYDPATGRVSRREPLALAFDLGTIDTGETATMAGLPAGAVVKVSGPLSAEEVHEGGDFSFGSDVPGRYVIEVEAFPALPTRFEVEVIP